MAACILPNTFDDYKSKALKVMPSDAAPIFTDDFVKTVLESNAVRYFENNDRSLFKDYDAIATKALIAGYVRTLKQSSDDNVRKFIPDDVNKKLNIELANLQLTPKSVASYIDKIKKSIVSESIVSDDGNVEIKQNLTLSDYGVETIEMQDIRSKAIADGTFMKAPNGKPTNLTERQWLQVRTKAFKEWFGDWINDPANASKVVDDNGEPLVVYHGSRKDNITIFEPHAPLYNNKGVYFARKKNRAIQGNKIYEAFLNIKNPLREGVELIYSPSEEYKQYIERQWFGNSKKIEEYTASKKYNPQNDAQFRYLRNQLRDDPDADIWKQYDGIIDVLEIVAFNPNQIKSATDNVGTFSKENNDIYDTLKQDLGGGTEAEQEIKDAVSVAVKGISFEEALKGQESFFTKEEQEKIKQSLNGKNLQVMSVSRLTDPAFFAKEIVSFLEQNAKKDLSDPTRVQAIEIWSKHDGLPIKSILDACKKYRVAPMVSFSITGLGGTSLEGGVMKYKDMLQKVGELIKNGTLNPTTTTVRIDPILVGVTSMDDIKDIVKTAKSFGIKKFVTSLVQSYGYTEGTPKDRKVISGINNALAEEGKTYDWDKYYGRDRNGKINFKPKKEYVDEVSKVLLELDKDPEITIQTCAFGINGLKVSACLDPMIIERIVGTSVINPDGTYDRDTSRPECMCYGCHSDFFKGKNKKCYSSCAYCYAAHSGDNKLNYYNEDGTLKDNDFTRTEQPQPTVAKNATTEFDVSNAEFYSGAADGSDKEWGKQARALGIKVIDYKVENFDKLSDDWKARIEKEYLESRAFLGKRPLKGDTYGGKLTRRDMMQADKADAIFAIAERIVNPGGIEYSGGKEYTNNTNHDNVQGGTANAVARGIIRGIPIYVFDQSDNQWKQWNAKSKSFETINDVPTLTQHAAVIGTRGINDDGKKAVTNVLNKTLGKEYATQQSTTKPKNESTPNNETISSSKLSNTVLYSNYSASDGLFNNANVDSIDDMLKNGSEVIVLFTNTQSERDEAIAKAMSYNKGKAKKDWCILRINPSDDEIKTVIANHNKIGIFRGNNSTERNIDNLYKNVTITTSKADIDNADFMENHDLNLFSNKVRHLYTQNRLQHLDAEREQIMRWVLQDIQKEYNDMSDADKDTYKGIMLKKLADNYEHVTSIITVIEQVDTDSLEDYDYENREDVLFKEQHHTSNMPKDDILASVLASFQTGKEDELGTPLHYDSTVINNILTRTISGSKDSNDMIGRLKSAQRYNKWMDKLIENINSDTTGRLKSILFTNYANLYAAKFVTINGNRIIDESSDFATTSINVGVVSEMDEKRSPFSKEITDKTCKNIADGLKIGGELKKLPDYREQYKQYLDDKNSRLVFYLAQAGIELNPDEHDINALTDDELTTIRQNLAMIYQLRARDGWMETENFIANCKSSYSKILAVLNKYSNQKTESTVRTAGETQFVYADKNYIDTIFDGLDEDYKAFMQKEFLDYGEFTSDHSGDYEKMSMKLYSSLLRDLALSTSKPEWFRIAHFFVNKENGKNPAKYSDLTKDDLAEINRKMFWKEQGITKQGDKQYVWVHAPIYADKGQLHFYRVPIVELEAQNLDDDNPDTQMPQILKEIVNLIKFETNRISDCKKRSLLIKDGKIKPIDVYDTVWKFNEKTGKLEPKIGNGEMYCFQPMLNEYGVDENGKPVSLYDILAAEDSKENREYIMRQAAAKIIANIIKQDCKQEIKGTDTEKNVAEGLNNQVDEWAERIEETLSDNLDGYNKVLNEIRRFDYSQSKEKRDRQKQWEEDNDIENDENTTSAQIGERMIERIQRALTSYVRQADILQLTISDPAMYKGEVDVQKRYAQVQAGYSRPDIKSKYAKRFMSTLYLKDNEIDLESVDPVTFNIMRATLERASKAANIDLNVDEIMKSFKKVNVADAQCYRTLSSYRAVRDMFGQWTAKDDALFEKIRNGEQLTADDYMQVWQTLKPFVYTQQPSEWIDADGVKHKTKVGYQYKNSENVLFNMYLLFNGGKKTVLGELNRFMEQYKIDTAQFESAVKVGREGLIDLNNIDAEDVFEYLEKQTGVKDQTTKLKYTDIDENGNEVEKEEELPGNPHVIHRIPYKEYGIKTSTPPHMFDVEQQLGSQLKKLLQGDIPDNAKIYLDTDGLFGNESESQFGEGNRTILVNGEVITLSENKEIQPDGTEKTRWSLNKQDYLKLYNGLLNDLILSEYGNVQDIFKDRERLSQALQEMMGTSPKYDYDIKQALKVKDGKFIVDPKNPAIRDKVVLLMSSILKNRINKQLTKGGTAIQMACWKRQPPLNIVRNPDGTIKYMECLMPAYSKQWIESMMNKDGVLDPKKCKDENLLKALCYRVPTEDIYSMIPLKIVGFTPLQFGTNIMLPQEITTLTGSDFDVDKMYLFLPEFELKDKWNIDPKVARERFEKSLVSKTADYEADVEIKNTNKRRSENEEPELTDEEKEKIRTRIKKDYFNAYCVEQKYKVQEPRYVQFDSKKDISDNSKSQKCNLLLALMRGAISSPHNITKEQNPGGFDYLKELAEEINPEVDKPMNLTESQYLNFFNLNMTGKRLIGIYANHNVAHSLCQDSGLGLAKSIKIGDNEYNSLSGIYSTDKRRISRNIAEFLAASVDNAKDPVLAKLWQNNYTASTTCFLMRLGVPPKTILKMYKMLKDKCPEDFNKFMERGPAAFRKYADKYNADLKLGINVKFQDGNKNVNTYNFFAMLGYYEKTIQNLETLNSLLKSDSTNGAMYDVTSIIENILKVKKLKQDQNLVNVDKLIPDFENDKELLNKSKSEILKDIEQKVGKGNAKSYQVAYYLTWANFRQYFNEIIDDKMINECINLGMQLPNFSSDDIKHFIADYTKQQLRYLDMFAPRVESMKKNRKQLMELGLEEASKYRIITTSEIIKNTLEEIPKKLEEYKRKYKDNAFIQMLSRVQQKDGVFLMIKNIADMRAETVNEVKEAFNQLYSNDSSFGDAMDLIRYTLCVNGFGYDPRSFVSMIPIKTLAKVKGIENVFEFFEIDKLDNFEDNFIIKNDLVDYSVKIPSKHDNVFFMPTKSKIIGKMKIKDFKSTIINLIVNLNLEEKQITQLTKEFERDLKKDFKVDEKLFDEYEDFEGNANNNFLGRISSLINNNKEIIKIFDEETDDYKIAIEDLKKLYRIKYTIENHNGAFYKKMYETKDGAYYVSMEEKEQPDTHDKIYEVFDKEIVSNWLGAVTDEEGNFEYDANDELEVDEDVRKNSLKAIVDDVMKEAALQGLDTQTVTKEDLVKILNSENALGRYFNLDADPMSVYEPIAIEFC